MGDMLSTGVSALLAYKRALDTTGHNIANVNTDGYSRQRVDLTTRVGQNLGRYHIGSGVQIGGVERLQERFVFDQILEAGARQASLERLSTLSGQIDNLFSDNATSMAEPLRNFFDAADGVAAEPLSNAARQVMIEEANSLVSRGQLLYNQLSQLDSESNQQLLQIKDDANNILSDIAQLNRNIALAEASAAGSPPNDLLDERDRQLTALSELMSISTVTQDDGAINVFASNGQPLVVGQQASQLLTTSDPFGGGRLSMALQTPAGPQPLGNVDGGVLGGIQSFRENVLDPAIARLGRITSSVALASNQQQAQGIDLYGNTGADLFNLPDFQADKFSGNTGTADLTATYSDPATLGTEAFELRYDGANWTAVGLNSGSSLSVSGAGTPADPLVVQGMSVTVSGAAAAGDRFQLNPGREALSALSVAMSDPSAIAAASPIRSSASVSNLGAATIDAGTVVDINDPALSTPSTISFVDANNYTIDGNGPFAYTSGNPITANGWQVRISGTAAAGDTFTVSPTPAGSSDNRNALSFGGLGDINLLDGGSASITGAHSAMVASVGTQTRSADIQLGAQTAVRNELQGRLEAVSGVNLDEEAANLIKFQQSYQAAAQVIATADTLFQSLLAAVRR
ncbi:MAG: flagellar hook-associated protein FlgK [Salinisphaeraceae bacterium]|nr:flagellar hook-associated protein FlgK [Salinisphaeraceae bacterium]